MNNFDRALVVILDHEGGYVNHPQDPGGETNYGITKNVAKENGYSGSMKTIPLEFVRRIYREKYWDKCACEGLEYGAALNVFDAAVNHGVTQAIKFMQRALTIADDGILGNKTLACLRQMKPDYFVARFVAERLSFYTKLKTFPTFGKGWVSRVASCLKEASVL